MTANNHLVCIKRQEPGLLSQFEDMYLNERLVDVTLFCHDGQLQAHKLVLAACSPYFCSIFDKIANPFHHPVIVLKDMRIDDLRLILEFMYRGQLTLNSDRMSTLLRNADNLQITGLTNGNGAYVDANDQTVSISGNSVPIQKIKRAKRGSGPNLNQMALARSYQTKNSGDANTSQSEKLLQQSMMVDESMDGLSSNRTNNNAFYPNNDPISSRNLNTNSLHTPSPSSVQHLQQLPTIDNLQHQHHHQQQQHQHQQLNNQLQVLSHKLSSNRTGAGQSVQNGIQQVGHIDLDHLEGRRLHTCNICWKTFREKANLKRHLQIHSSDRTTYTCSDCNKTFTWKDNFIRHTKTSHHINNVRTRK